MGLGMSGAALHLLSYASRHAGLQGVENKVLALTQAGARNLVIHEKTTFSFIALLVCDQGMVMVTVVGDGSSTTLLQVGDIVPKVQAVSVVSKLKHILVVTKESDDFNELSVSSCPKFNLMECSNTGLCSPADWAFNTHWAGAGRLRQVYHVGQARLHHHAVHQH